MRSRVIVVVDAAAAVVSNKTYIIVIQIGLPTRAKT